jgi:hypothetical protein
MDLLHSRLNMDNANNKSILSVYSIHRRCGRAAANTYATTQQQQLNKKWSGGGSKFKTNQSAKFHTTLFISSIISIEQNPFEWSVCFCADMC